MSEKQQGLVDDLNDLQAFCESLKPGEVVVISGGAGVGKTTLAMRMAIALVSSSVDEDESAKRVLVFSPKHPSEFFVANGFSRRRIYVDDLNLIDAPGIELRTRTMKRCFGTDLLIVDAVDRIGDILPELRDLAIELKIPVVITEERVQDVFCEGLCERMKGEENCIEPDIAICLRRNPETGKCCYCMNRKVVRMGADDEA